MKNLKFRYGEAMQRSEKPNIIDKILISVLGQIRKKIGQKLFPFLLDSLLSMQNTLKKLRLAPPPRILTGGGEIIFNVSNIYRFSGMLIERSFFFYY